jgi:hypothetical protein
MTMRHIMMATLLALLAGGSAQASADERAQPPANAFDACRGKTLAADCRVASLDTGMDGLCVIEGQDHLYCLPYELSLPPDGYLN